MKMTIAACISLLLSLPLTLLSAAEPPPPGIARLHRLDLLPQFKDSVFVGSISSYDRTGGNDDGFSGKYSYVSKDGEDLVLADLEGPGVIHRIWTPTPTDDVLEFYFDGEADPRLRVKFRDLFTRGQPPFVLPLVGNGAGGFYSYVPLPYQKSCKIVARTSRLQFYQINYARYSPESTLTTWTPEPSPEYLKHQQQAQELFAASGTDISDRVVSADASLAVHATDVSLQPGSAATLFTSNAGGRIGGIRISPASKLAGKDRALVLRITWDGQSRPAVLCPAGDFFGYAWGQSAMKSLLIGTAEDTSYCYYPMPFDKSAKIELISQKTDGPPVALRAEVIVASEARRAGEGRFHAAWRRENPTTKGEPFTFIDTKGRGHVVGCILQAQGMVSGSTGFFEGDDQTTIDGQLTIHGTGSEDFFNGGWYDVPGRWEKTLSFPLSGCLDYQKHLGRTGGYRLMLGDAYAFRESILQTIEHAPTGNDMTTDYAAVSYVYLQDPPTDTTSLPPVEQRAVVDFGKLVFKPDWSVPIRAFTFRGATITKMDEEINGRNVGFLRLTAVGGDWVGPPFVSLECDFPVAGKYRVSVEAIRGPQQARVQLFRNEVPAGSPVDLYATERALSGNLPMGVVDVEEGPTALLFKLVDKNESAPTWGFDLARIHCEKVED